MAGEQKAGGLQGSKDLRYIPLVIRYTAGTPAILQNPTGEAITSVADTGTGEVTVTLTEAGIAPLIVVATSRPSAPSTLGGQINLKGATTTSAFVLLCNQGDDGATEVDPVDIHVLVIKQIAA